MPQPKQNTGAVTPPPHTPVDVRQKIVDWANWFVQNKNKRKTKVHYAEIRPIPHTLKFPMTTDCSGFVTLLHQLAGAADPNGYGFNGQGYTGTLLTHGRHIVPSAVLPGDIVIYGAGTGEHAAVIVKVHGNDFLTVSHGQEGDPSYCWVSKPLHTPQGGYAIDGRKPVTFLRFNTTQQHPSTSIPS